MDHLLTVAQIAAYLHVKSSRIFQWTHEGHIPHVKLGNLMRFRVSAVESWLEKREVTGKTKRRVQFSLEPVKRAPSTVT